VVQLVTLIAVFQGTALFPAYAEKDDKLLLHIAKGHVVSIAFQEKEGPLTGCWEESFKIGNREINTEFILHQNDSKVKTWTVSRPDQIYQGDVKGNKLLIRYQVKSADDFRGKDIWYNAETGEVRSRPSRQMAQKILSQVGQHPIYYYQLDIIDRATLSGQGNHINYSHNGEEFISARMRIFASDWKRKESVPVKSVKFLADHAVSGQAVTVQAQADSKCTIGLDRAEARLYPGHDKARAMTVELVETAPDSNILKSAPLTIPAGWKADFIRLQAGIRGAKIPLNGASSPSSPSSAKQQTVPEDHPEKLSAARDELDSLRQQWKTLGNLIDEERARGNDVTNLVRNERRLTAEIQQARKRLVALKRKYGTVPDIKKKISPGPANNNTGSKSSGKSSTSSPFKIPGFSFGGNSKSSPPGTGKKSSRKSPAKPLAGKPAISKNAPLVKKQPVLTPSRWTVYRLKTLSQASGHLPDINVIRIAFRRSASRVAMVVKSYPLSMVRNDQGIILWSVNWQNGDIQQNRMAGKPDDRIKLEQEAGRLKAGSVSEQELDSLINKTLGPKARKKK